MIRLLSGSSTGVARVRFDTFSASFALAFALCVGCFAHSETVGWDSPGTPGYAAKQLDPHLYNLCSSYVELEREIACDTCFGEEVVEGLRQLRNTTRTSDETEYVSNVLKRELQSSPPNWDLAWTALKTAEFGMWGDQEILESCIGYLEMVPIIPEDRLMVAAQAANVLAIKGNAEHIDILIATLHVSKISDKNGNLTKKRRVLGLSIVDALGVLLPEQGAITTMQTIVEIVTPLLPVQDPEMSYEFGLLSTAENHLDRWRDSASATQTTGDTEQ